MKLCYLNQSFREVVNLEITKFQSLMAEIYMLNAVSKLRHMRY